MSILKRAFSLIEAASGTGTNHIMDSIRLRENELARLVVVSYGIDDFGDPMACALSTNIGVGVPLSTTAILTEASNLLAFARPSQQQSIVLPSGVDYFFAGPLVHRFRNDGGVQTRNYIEILYEHVTVSEELWLQYSWARRGG